MCEQIRTRTRHWSMLRYWLLVFSLESKLENKLVVSLSCRLGIARGTKVSIKKRIKRNKKNNFSELRFPQRWLWMALLYGIFLSLQEMCKAETEANEYLESKKVSEISRFLVGHLLLQKPGKWAVWTKWRTSTGFQVFCLPSMHNLLHNSTGLVSMVFSK
jgi:hypothetical protein